jgi:hypothetical protein
LVAIEQAKNKKKEQKAFIFFSFFGPEQSAFFLWNTKKNTALLLFNHMMKEVRV